MHGINPTRSVEEVRESEERLRLFVENAPVALAMFDREMRYLAVSCRFVSEFEAPPEILGRCHYDVFPEIPERWKQIHRRALAGEILSAEKDVLRRANGKAQWVKWEISPWTDANGKVGGLLLATEDITARVLAQRKLRESEERLALAVESAGLGTWDWDVETDTFVCSRHCLEMFGLPPNEDPTYQRFLEAVHPEDRERVDQGVKGALEKRALFHVEMRTVWPDGSVHWLSSRGRAYFDDFDRPVRMSGAATEITSLKKTQQELEQSQMQARAQADELRAILDTVPAMTFIAHERECRRMTSSRSAYEMLRLPQGSNSSKSAPKEERPSFMVFEGGRLMNAEELPIQQAARTGREVRNKELKILFEDGAFIDIFGHAVPLMDDSGEPKGAVGAFVDITELKRAARQLKESEERWRLAAEISRIGFHDYDLQKDGSIWSSEIYSITGIPVGTRVGFRTMLSAIHPEDRGRVTRAFEASLNVKGNGEFAEEFRILHHTSGETRWLFNRSRTLFEESTNGRRAVRNTGILLDITERKQIEEALRVSDARNLAMAQRFREGEERLRLALEAADMGTWEWDLSSDRVNWSEAMESHLAMEPGSFQGNYKTFLGLVHPEDRERVNQAVMRSIKGKEPYRIEFRMMRTDGGVRWSETRGSVIRDESGKPVKLVGVDMDITERKMADERLDEQRARTEFVAEAADVGFWFCDLPFDKLIWDKRVKAHFWLAPEAEVTIDTFYEQLHPDDRERTRRAIEESIGNRTTYEIEYRTVAPDGRCKWIRAIGRTFYDGAGHPRRFDGVTLDITERKKAVEGLQASEARHREMAKNLDGEIQARTQELRHRNDQLFATLDGLEALSSRILRIQDEERRHIARELHDSAGQLLTALGLELACLESEMPELASPHSQRLEMSKDLLQQLQREIRTTSYLLHPPLLDEAGLVSAVKWYVQGLNQRSGLQTNLEIRDDFGRLPGDLEMLTFRLIQESLMNIHRHSGSKTAVIRIGRDAERVTIEIRDEGKGISAEKLREIQVGGSGVGVQGMRERLGRYQGRLQIESGDWGTRVLATIPITLNSQDDDGNEALPAAV